MNNILSKLVKVVLFSLVLITNGFTYASESPDQNTKKDNLFVFVFKEGVAQKDIEVQVDDVRAITDKFGTARFQLPAGEHEVSYLNGGELFALTEVKLLETVSSQIFLNLTKKGADVELDLPLSAYEQNFETESLKEQTGPKGILRVVAKDTATQEIIAGAKLFFKGYAIDAVSDENGVAEVELSEGSYDISLIHPKYVMQVIKDVKVKADATSETSVLLVKADIVLDEFVVSAPFVEGSLASNIAELKESDVVGDAISSEQFSKAGDSSAAGALKRVTGITIVDGKFVFVRGLGERYSTVLLNGLEVPSPEPTKRVVPLDIFPAGVIQSLDIQKTYSSNLPGTFGGGTVVINTKDIPKEDNYIKGSIGVTMHDTTGDSVVYNEDNRVALPGLLINLTDGFAKLDDEIPGIREGINSTERFALDREIATYRQYTPTTTTLAPGSSLSISAGQSFKTSGGMKYGFAGNVYYKSDQKSKEIEEEVFIATGNADEPFTHDDSNRFEQTTLTEKYGGLISFGFEPNETNKLKYTFLGLMDFNDSTKFGERNDLKEGDKNESYLFRYTEKELFSHQVNGEHSLNFASDKSFFNTLDVDWAYSMATATRLEPGTVEYQYKESPLTTSGMIYDPEKTFYQYSNLEDDATNYRLDLSLPFLFNENKGHVTLGFYGLEKERSLDNRRFRVQYTVNRDTRLPDERDTIDEIMTPDLASTSTFDVKDVYKQEDFYTANQSLTAMYINTLISATKDLDFNFGVRQESSTQELNVGIEAENVKNFELDTSDTLPFFGATYRLTDEHQFRFGLSQTITRPDFREFSPNRYKDPITDYIVFGYPELEQTTISNMDVKYEWFPSFDEFLSFGVFTKDFDNPIETVRQRVDEDIEISYRNADSARSFGLEFGFRKSMTPFAKWLENYFFEGNYAHIDSQVELDKENPEYENDSFIVSQTSDDRPMQGQSPYVANLKFGYDNFFTKRSAMFLYNVYGERISSLGINNNPDIYEQPFHRVDFVVKWGINDTYDDQEKKIGYSVSLKLKNLLDSSVEKTQGDKVVETYKPGRSLSLGFSMKF